MRARFLVSTALCLLPSLAAAQDVRSPPGITPNSDATFKSLTTPGAVTAGTLAGASAGSTVNDAIGLPVLGFDGSVQGRVGGSLSAIDYPHLLSGPASDATLLFDSDVSANVPGNIAMKGTGDLTIGNANGVALRVSGKSAVTDGWFQAETNSTYNFVTLRTMGLANYQGAVSNYGIALVPRGTGAFTLASPDGTATGGNARGANAADLQTSRGAATQVASGNYSFTVGQNSTASGTGAVAAGLSNNVFGAYSVGLGQNGSDGFRPSLRYFSTGFSTAQGDRQITETLLVGTLTGGTAKRLTVDGGAAATTNSMPLTGNKVFSMRVTCSARNTTTAGQGSGWYNNLLVQKDATNATLTVTAGTPTTLGAAVTIAATADTTNGELNLTATAPNTDTWRVGCRLDTAEIG